MNLIELRKFQDSYLQCIQKLASQFEFSDKEILLKGYKEVLFLIECLEREETANYEKNRNTN